MSEDEFTRLFKYMQAEFGKVNQKLDERASQSSVDRLTDAVHDFVKRLDHEETEQVFRDHQFEKLLEWARKVSEKTGIPLEGF